jgi:hypothetical protein
VGEIAELDGPGDDVGGDEELVVELGSGLHGGPFFRSWGWVRR